MDFFRYILKNRIFTGIAVFLLLVFGYWWLTWIVIILLLFYFRNYYEIIIWGIVYDSLYGIHLPVFWNIKYMFTVFSVMLFILTILLRKYLIAYDDKV